MAHVRDARVADQIIMVSRVLSFLARICIAQHHRRNAPIQHTLLPNAICRSSGIISLTQRVPNSFAALVHSNCHDAASEHPPHFHPTHLAREVNSRKELCPG